MPTPKLTIEEMQEIAKSRGGECLSKTYVNWKTKLMWRCSEGHVWRASSHSVRNSGSWCPICGYVRAGLKRRKRPDEIAEILKAGYPSFPKIDPRKDRRRKLTEEQWKEIRLLHARGYSITGLARTFGISYYHTYCIAHPDYNIRKNRTSSRCAIEQRKRDPEAARKYSQSQRKSFKRRMKEPEFREWQRKIVSLWKRKRYYAEKGNVIVV